MFLTDCGPQQFTLQKGVARSFTLGVIIVVIAVAGMAAIFVAGGAVSNGIGGVATSIGGSSTSTSTGASFPPLTGPPPAGFGQQVLQTHLQRLNNRDVIGATNDYAQNGVMIWTGNTQGLGGTYSGRGNIHVTLQTAIGSASSLSYTITSFNASGSSSNPNVAGASAVLNFDGKSAILGIFNGTINAKYEYVNQGGTWVIQQELSDYTTFNVQFSQGSTTFPQWQMTGPQLPQRYSESPFKNWVYFYGGAAAAIAVAGYLSTLPIVIYVKKKRTSNRASERRPQQD
jgi:hypothetical protein